MRVPRMATTATAAAWQRQSASDLAGAGHRDVSSRASGGPKKGRFSNTARGSQKEKPNSGAVAPSTEEEKKDI